MCYIFTHINYTFKNINYTCTNINYNLTGINYNFKIVNDNFSNADDNFTIFTIINCNFLITVKSLQICKLKFTSRNHNFTSINSVAFQVS